MSGTKRTRVNRPRKAADHANTVGLFRQLEKVPMSRRDNEAFEDLDYELHARLGLREERRLSQQSVLDRYDRPSCGPAYTAHWAWHKVYAVRL
jgi:hypothetical protein